MSVIEHYRVSRWHDRFPPRGAWRAFGAIVAFCLLAQGTLAAALAVLAAFAVAEVVHDAAGRTR